MVESGVAVSGYVLAGGRSTRMGRDKALLPYRGATLAAHVAGIVREALSIPGQTGAVALIGDPVRYANLGYPIHADLVADCGPLGGIFTAVTLAATDWSLVVACDMPGLSIVSLRTLIARAGQCLGNCVIATGAGGEPEPLCAIYHRRCLPVLDRAVRDKRLKMRDLVPELEPEIVPLPPSALANVNTPEEWADLAGSPR
jgi:molybdopterin-guanine dinucleotide biosynthesis protein A